MPVRYDNDVVAVLTHQTALAARKASPLERAYLDCAGDLLHMLSEGTFPNVGDLADVAVQSRASVTGSSGSTWPVSWSSPAPTRCRPITGWA